VPSFTATPATLAIEGGNATFEPARFSATSARLSIVPGSATFSVGSDSALSVTTPTLDRLTRFDEILEGTGPSTRFQLIWQQTMEAIEDAFAALTTQVGDNTSVIARLVAAENLAAAANDNAVSTSNELALANSYINPVGVLTASSAGVVTIEAHERVYGTSPVAVNGGSVSGFAPGAAVTVYYADLARSGGAVTFQGSTSAISQTGGTHIVGQVTIPAVGQPDEAGSGPTAPGWKFPDGLDPRLIEYELNT
jgi:hypothetical protein